MSQKKLPKAIARSTVTSSAADTTAGASEQRHSRPQRRASKAPAISEPSPQHTSSQRTVADAKSKEQSESKTTQPSIEGELLPPTAVGNITHAVKRRAIAEQIVERYKLYAALGGLAPLPVVTAAGVTTIILRMVKLLNDLYQVQFDHHRTRSIVAGLMGGAVPTGLGVATASTLALVLPGVGFVGVAVSSRQAHRDNRVKRQNYDNFTGRSHPENSRYFHARGRQHRRPTAFAGRVLN